MKYVHSWERYYQNDKAGFSPSLTLSHYGKGIFPLVSREMLDLGKPWKQTLSSEQRTGNMQSQQRGVLSPQVRMVRTKLPIKLLKGSLLHTVPAETQSQLPDRKAGIQLPRCNCTASRRKCFHCCDIFTKTMRQTIFINMPICYDYRTCNLFFFILMWQYYICLLFPTWTSSIPGEATCLGCELSLRYGACRRKVSFSLSLSI